MKKVLSIILALMMVLALTACGGGGGESSEGSSEPAAEAQTYTLNITTGETSAWQVAANTFADLVKERSEGRINIEVYPNEQLASGDMTKGVEMLFTDVADFDIHSVMNMGGYEEKLAVMTMPWLFANGYDDVDKYLLKGEGGEALKELIGAKGPHVLAFGENGFRQLTNNVRPVHEAADMKNMKVRIPSNNMYISLFKLMGADPTSMSFSEVFTALQQKTIDGQENPLDTILSGSIQEVQKYMTMWNYSYDAIALSCSGRLWNTFSPEDQQMLEEAAVEACEAQVKASREKDAENLQKIKDAGVEVNELTPEEIAAFQEVVAPIYEEYKDIIGEDLFAKFGYTF